MIVFVVVVVLITLLCIITSVVFTLEHFFHHIAGMS